MATLSRKQMDRQDAYFAMEDEIEAGEVEIIRLTADLAQRRGYLQEPGR